MKATNIQWDVDDPKDIEMLPEEMDIPEGLTNPEDISDYISNETGFCHCGFVLEAD